MAFVVVVAAVDDLAAAAAAAAAALDGWAAGHEMWMGMKER